MKGFAILYQVIMDDAKAVKIGSVVGFISFIGANVARLNGTNIDFQPC